ncbi:non-homologous end-joining factor 1 [Platichthys flesus]|uniref:non-homologous end-joining factor 1 n=1 Tax=Platichthys flesus TaxID=8260 RepID=UPI002DBB2D22|nr:non-homologous end-joining factor 1 [Platichthys flesus]XP_062236267.1 non-homologous end-joining factor 1 [Platichthys flesus]XP_062236268.1 non-homologous end-joining factor 1 [Platichthys flesus]
MEVNGAPPDVLLQHPWLPVGISGCQLLAKIWFGDAAYHILLTDMSCVWEERMDSAAIQRRSQELNRRLRAPVKAFFSHLCEVAQPILSGSGEQADGEAQISLTRREDDNISIRLKSELAEMPFYWEFRCTPAPVTLVCTQLLRPLLAMSRLLQRQVGQLGGLLVKKDVEIQDYRENGATLSRERLQTDVFEEQTNRENFISKALPLVCSEQQETLGFDDDLQQLYASIVAHENTRALKRKLSEERSVQEDPPATEEQDLTPSLGVGSVSESPEKVGEQSHKRTDATGATKADGATVQKSFDRPAVRPSSKPKKKKVGLFR